MDGSFTTSILHYFAFGIESADQCKTFSQSRLHQSSPALSLIPVSGREMTDISGLSRGKVQVIFDIQHGGEMLSSLDSKKGLMQQRNGKGKLVSLSLRNRTSEQ